MLSFMLQSNIHPQLQEFKPIYTSWKYDDINDISYLLGMF
jgi:hypothetical protein